jgi:hypothetical protein
MIDAILAIALEPDRARRQLKALLLRGDADFTRCAYLAAGGCEPTADEFAKTMRRLGGGARRVEVLGELLAAKTAASGRADSRWLRNALRRDRVGRLPLRRALTRLSLNPLPWLIRLVFRRFINEDPKAAFVMLEHVPTGDAGTESPGERAGPDPTEARVADRVYRDLAAAAVAKAR